MLTYPAQLPVWSLPLFGLIALTTYLIYNKYGYGIAAIPGPFGASFTDFWRFLDVWGRRPEATHIKLHEKYGPVVRLGPNLVSVTDHAALKVIYGLAAGYIKSDFYPVQQQTVTRDGQVLQGLFSTTDEKYHAKLRRAVNNAYAMSTLIQFEPFVDSTTIAFLNQLSQRYADRSDTVCDLGQWLQFYAFDVIGELTFSKRLGFLDHGIDVDNIISNNEWILRYFALVGQMPWLDKLLIKNPIRIWLSRMGVINATSPVAIFAAKQMDGRVKGPQARTDDVSAEAQQPRRDFLSRFLEASEKDPVFMHAGRVRSLTTANVFAGSDTTAISLRSIFYYLLKNSEKLERLRSELDEAQKNGKFTREDKLVRWTEVNQLPYLSAVIKEALRIHPAAGLLLERVVPQGGLEVAGHYIPAGTIVGASPWVLHRDKKVFGDDVDAFRPERWLEDTEKASEMNQFLFSFGGGSRTCIGKNISYLEMYKLVPAILRTFDVKLAEPSEEWHIDNRWFVKQSNFYVRLTSRGNSEA